MVGNSALLWSSPSPFPCRSKRQFNLISHNHTALERQGDNSLVSVLYCTIREPLLVICRPRLAFCCGMSDTSRKGLFPFLSLRHCRPQVLHLEEGPEDKANTVANKQILVNYERIKMCITGNETR